MQIVRIKNKNWRFKTREEKYFSLKKNNPYLKDIEMYIIYGMYINMLKYYNRNYLLWNLFLSKNKLIYENINFILGLSDKIKLEVTDNKNSTFLKLKKYNIYVKTITGKYIYNKYPEIYIKNILIPYNKKINIIPIKKIKKIIEYVKLLVINNEKYIKYQNLSHLSNKNNHIIIFPKNIIRESDINILNELIIPKMSTLKISKIIDITIYYKLQRLFSSNVFLNIAIYDNIQVLTDLILNIKKMETFFIDININIDINIIIIMGWILYKLHEHDITINISNYLYIEFLKNIKNIKINNITEYNQRFVYFLMEKIFLDEYQTMLKLCKKTHIINMIFFIDNKFKQNKYLKFKSYISNNVKYILDKNKISFMDFNKLHISKDQSFIKNFKLNGKDTTLKNIKIYDYKYNNIIYNKWNNNKLNIRLISNNIDN